MANHPVQSCAADEMRIVMIGATETGIRVCASLHDGFLITAPDEQIDDDAAKMVKIMKGAGAALLGVRVNVGKPQIVRYPDRFVPDPKKDAYKTWVLILRELSKLTGTDFSYAIPEEVIEWLKTQVPPFNG